MATTTGQFVTFILYPLSFIAFYPFHDKDSRRKQPTYLEDSIKYKHRNIAYILHGLTSNSIEGMMNSWISNNKPLQRHFFHGAGSRRSRMTLSQFPSHIIINHHRRIIKELKVKAFILQQQHNTYFRQFIGLFIWTQRI